MFRRFRLTTAAVFSSPVPLTVPRMVPHSPRLLLLLRTLQTHPARSVPTKQVGADPAKALGAAMFINVTCVLLTAKTPTSGSIPRLACRLI